MTTNVVFAGTASSQLLRLHSPAISGASCQPRHPDMKVDPEQLETLRSQRGGAEIARVVLVTWFLFGHGLVKVMVPIFQEIMLQGLWVITKGQPLPPKLAAYHSHASSNILFL
jgi:hypothetical protein